MLFSRRRVQTTTGGSSFADGFVDGYHSILPDREPDQFRFGISRLAPFHISVASDQVPRKL